MLLLFAVLFKKNKLSNYNSPYFADNSSSHQVSQKLLIGLV